MSKFRLLLPLVVVLSAGGGVTLGQTETATPPPDAGSASPKPTSSSDRLFLAFAEDATVVERQWWEGQLATYSYDEADLNAVYAVAAFQPWIDWEVGGKVGFGDTDLDSGDDGSGATDLDLWGKYYLAGSGNTEFAVGGLATIPTGDETAGLGDDAFGLGPFGAVRVRLSRLVITGHVGVQFNGDGKRFNENDDRDGETAPILGGGVIFPLSDRVTLIGEARFHDGRLDGDDEDARALAGINWRPGSRGVVRFAVGAGLSDDAPDFQAQAGYAAQF